MVTALLLSPTLRTLFTFRTENSFNCTSRRCGIVCALRPPYQRIESPPRFYTPRTRLLDQPRHSYIWRLVERALLQCETFISWHNDVISPFAGPETGLLTNLVCCELLNGSRTFRLAYSVSVLGDRASNIGFDMESSDLILNARMSACCCCIRVSKLYWKCNTVFEHVNPQIMRDNSRSVKHNLYLVSLDDKPLFTSISEEAKILVMQPGKWIKDTFLFLFIHGKSFQYFNKIIFSG